MSSRISDLDEVVVPASTDEFVINQSGTSKKIPHHKLHYLLDGTASDPALRFFNDLDTGIFLIEDGKFGVSAGGMEAFSVNTLPDPLSDWSPGTDNFRNITIGSQANRLAVWDSYYGALYPAGIDFSFIEDDVLLPETYGICMFSIFNHDSQVDGGDWEYVSRTGSATYSAIPPDNPSDMDFFAGIYDWTTHFGSGDIYTVAGTWTTLQIANGNSVHEAYGIKAWAQAGSHWQTGLSPTIHWMRNEFRSWISDETQVSTLEAIYAYCRAEDDSVVTTAKGINLCLSIRDNATVGTLTGIDARYITIGSNTTNFYLFYIPDADWNGAALEDQYIVYQTGTTPWHIGGNLTLDAEFIHTGAKIGLFSATPVVQPSGYTTFDNLSTDRTLDADSTTLDEVADVLGTLIEDLKGVGLISA